MFYKKKNYKTQKRFYFKDKKERLLALGSFLIRYSPASFTLPKMIKRRQYSVTFVMRLVSLSNLFVRKST